MIVCHRRQCVAAARQRGYALDAVMPCVVAQDGDRWTVDDKHAAYPRKRKPAGGPGTELKKLLGRIGIHATQNCTCTARANLMDRNELAEPGWCEANLDQIVGWLREEAGKRRLPFLDAVGKLLVKRAIRNASRETRRAEEARQAAEGRRSAV